MLLANHCQPRCDTGPGQFGEGAKVEINRLIQEGCSVQYWTGNAAWTFGRRVAQGCSVPELHVVVEAWASIVRLCSSCSQNWC